MGRKETNHVEIVIYLFFYFFIHYVPSTIFQLNRSSWVEPLHGLQSLPPSPKRAERKGRRRPFREAGSGHKQWNTVSCVDTFSIISKFSAQNSKI